MSKYSDLVVWQKSMDIVETVYKLTKLLPKEETYGLCSQMRRAAISIPSNIAEGQQRRTVKEFVNFLYIAKASNAELKTQILICGRLNYLPEELCGKTVREPETISKMLTKMINKLSENK